MSTDQGRHWSALPPTPDPHPQGIAGDLLHPTRLWLKSTSTGLYRSDDIGAHWSMALGVQGGIFAFAFAGSSIYASGDRGVFRSGDNGDHFTNMSSGTVFTTISVAPSQPDYLYALTGSMIERWRKNLDHYQPT